MLGNMTWLVADIPVHPNGVGLGLFHTKLKKLIFFHGIVHRVRVMLNLLECCLRN